MKEFYIKVSNIRYDILKVEADSEKEALNKMQNSINNKEIIVNTFNHNIFQFEIITDTSDIDDENITTI